MKSKIKVGDKILLTGKGIENFEQCTRDCTEGKEYTVIKGTINSVFVISPEESSSFVFFIDDVGDTVQLEAYQVTKVSNE